MCNQFFYPKQDFLFSSFSLKKNEKLCLFTNFNRFLIIFGLIINFNIEIQTQNIEEVYSNKIIGNNLSSIFLNDFTNINFSSNFDSILTFSTTQVPKYCGDKIWLTNQKKSNFNNISLNYNSYCGYFGNIQKNKMEIKTELLENSNLTLYNLTNNLILKGNSTLNDYFENFWFHLQIINSTNKNLISIKEISSNETYSTNQFEGFVEITNLNYNLEIYWIGILAVFGTIFILLSLSYAYYRYLSRNGQIEYSYTANGVIVHEPILKNSNELLK